MKPGAKQKEAAIALSRWIGWLAVAFWVAVVFWIVVWVAAPNCRQRVTLEFSDAERLEHVGGNCFAAYFGRTKHLPKDAFILEDDRELHFGDAVAGSDGTQASDLTPEQIAVMGAGYCQLDRAANVVYWSSSDSTYPLINGRHYRLQGAQYWRPATKTLVLTAVVPLLLALALTLWRRRGGAADFDGWRRRLFEAIDLQGASPCWLRWALALVVLAGFLPVVTATWSRYTIDTDSWDYCHGTLNRTPLTYFFIKTFDSHCDDAANDKDVHCLNGIFRVHDFHYLTAVRAWKVLWLFGAAALVWVLARFVNVWLLAASVCGLVILLPAGSLYAQTFWLDHIISEPLCYCVELLFLAAAAQYLYSRRLVWGLVLGGLLAAAVLVRPSNNVFLAVLPAAWLAHRLYDGFWRATLRTALLAVPLLLGTLAVCQYNQQKHGCFQTYTFKGYYLISVALQTAEPDDVDAFTDPKMHEFMRLCLVEYKDVRIAKWSLAAADMNTFGIAVPSFCRVYRDTLALEDRPDIHTYYRLSEGVFTQAATTLIRRHPRAYVDVVVENVKVYWRQNRKTHEAMLLALGLSLLLYWRTRYWGWLYLAFFAATPLLTMLPCVLTLYPLERYSSPAFFAEIVCLPLVIGLAVTRGRAGLQRVQLTEPPLVAPQPPVVARAA